METIAGKVIKYYAKPGVASVAIIDGLIVGNKIHITGHTTDFDQTVDSIERNHEQITVAAKGQIIGLKVDAYVRKHDRIYKIMI